MTSFNKLLTVSFLAVLLLAVALPFSVIFASESDVYSFDKTSIYDDLKDSTIHDKPFNIEDYPLNPNGTPELLAFTEFAFTLKYEYQKYYGLYIYLYYPQGNLVIDEDVHDIKMACKYKDNEPVDWCHYPLKFLSTDINGVLYKFKIMDSIAEPEYKIVDTFSRVAMSSTNRRYDINSIQLMEVDKETVDYSIGGSWTITGYDKGMHDTSMEESTLQSVATFENTLKLDVHSTYYRGWLNYAETAADQLSSVYFSVPNKIENNYDRLWAIDFDTYKYLSSPIFVIYDKYYPGASSLFVDYEQLFENLLNQRGLSFDEITSLNKYSWLSWGDDKVNTNGDAISYRYYYAKDPPAIASNDAIRFDEPIAWVFDSSSDYDFKISSEELLLYMETFSSTRVKDVRGQYSSLLFSNRYYSALADDRQVQSGINIGRTITTDEKWELRNLDSNVSFWDLLFKHTENKPEKFSPIQKVTYSEISSLSNDKIASTYFVNESDVPAFRAYVREQESINKVVYLFRFDIDTYITEPLNCENWGGCGYVAQEPIYLDFDIISLTYDKAGVNTVMPVVSNPIDIIAGIEPPVNMEDFELTLDFFNDFQVAIYSMLIVFFLAMLFIMLVLPILKSIFRIRKK